MHLDNHQILCAIARMSQFCCLTHWFQGVKIRLNFKHADNCVSLTGLHLKNPWCFPSGGEPNIEPHKATAACGLSKRHLPRPLTGWALGLAGTDLAGTGLAGTGLAGTDGQQRRLSAWAGVCRRRGRQKDPLTWWAWGRHTGEQHPPRSLLAAGAALPVGI